ncbi:MAG: Hpt domain-containing protein [Terracidiphilus sp.]
MNATSQSGSHADPSLSGAIDGLWRRFLPEIRERVTVLETAAQSVADRKLTLRQREAAQSAAHKLAGVLGTFGLTRGTVLARELELTYARESSPPPSAAASLAQTATALRTMIETRKPAS